MRSSFTILCFTLLPFFSFGQSLSLDNLISLQKKEIVDINDYLSTKGWEFSSTKQSDDGFMRSAQWAFDKDYNNNALAWLSATYLAETASLVYISVDAQVYNSIKAKAKEYNMKERSSTLGPNSIVAEYTGANYILNITIESREQKSPRYIFKLYLKSFLDGIE